MDLFECREAMTIILMIFLLVPPVEPSDARMGQWTRAEQKRTD